MQIIRLTAATFYGTGSGVAVNGAIAAVLNDNAVIRAGRSDGAMGDVTGDVTDEQVSGSLIVDDDDEDLALLKGTIGGLKLGWVGEGGTAVNTWIGRQSAIGGGVMFTGTGEIMYDSGDGQGAVPRTTLEFVGVYLPTHTVTVKATADDGTTTATWLIGHSSVS